MLSIEIPSFAGRETHKFPNIFVINITIEFHDKRVRWGQKKKKKIKKEKGKKMLIIRHGGNAMEIIKRSEVSDSFKRHVSFENVGVE